MRVVLTVGLDELDILADDLGLDRPIHPYEIPYRGGNEYERARWREKVHQRFRRAGVLSRAGRLDAEIEDLVRTWANPDVLFTQMATVVEEGSRFLYRGGWRGRVGVFTRQDGRDVVFDEVRPAQVVGEMIAVLPDWEPVYGTSTTFVQPGGGNGRGQPDQPSGGRDEFFTWPGAGTSPVDRQPDTHRFFDVPLLRYGLITCSAREPGTRLRPGRDVDVGSLTWFDTTEGRFFTTSENLPDGAVRYTITPADRSRIATWLHSRVDRDRDDRDRDFA